MSGIGVIIRAAGRVGGRVLGRLAGPLGAVIAIGELGYLGLKYSGTLENFKKLYCDKCRAEIPMKDVNGLGSDLDLGVTFNAPCPVCRRDHFIAKVHLLCPHCKETCKAPRPNRKVAVPTDAKYLLLTCPQCDKPVKFVKNSHFG